MNEKVNVRWFLTEGQSRLFNLEPRPRTCADNPTRPSGSCAPSKPPVSSECEHNQTLDIIGAINVVNDGFVLLAHQRSQNAPMQDRISWAIVHFFASANPRKQTNPWPSSGSRTLFFQSLEVRSSQTTERSAPVLQHRGGFWFLN